jgi:hypothetical protein
MENSPKACDFCYTYIDVFYDEDRDVYTCVECRDRWERESSSDRWIEDRIDGDRLRRKGYE